MQVKWLITALQNLDEQAAYIAQENPVAASNIVAQILTTVDLLTDQPAMGAPGRIAGTRELTIPGTRYLIPYRIRDGHIEILRVFHTARQPPKQW